MAPFEPNEILACLLVLLATGIIAVVRAHPANTARTRAWWGRFLVLALLLLAAQIATNLEQIFAVDTVANGALNLMEHLALLAASLWALNLSVNALSEACQRQADAGEAAGNGPDHSAA